MPATKVAQVQVTQVRNELTAILTAFDAEICDVATVYSHSKVRAVILSVPMWMKLKERLVQEGGTFDYVWPIVPETTP